MAQTKAPRVKVDFLKVFTGKIVVRGAVNYTSSQEINTKEGKLEQTKAWLGFVGPSSVFLVGHQTLHPNENLHLQQSTFSLFDKGRKSQHLNVSTCDPTRKDYMTPCLIGILKSYATRPQSFCLLGPEGCPHSGLTRWL